MLKNKKYTILDIVIIPMRYAPFYSILIAISKILDGIVPSLKILVTASFIDISISVMSSNENLSRLFPYIIAIVGLIGYSWLSMQFIKFIEVKQLVTLRKKVSIDIIEKRGKLLYKYIENSKSWDLISRVCNEPEVKFQDAYINLLRLITMIIKIIGILLIIIKEVWWAALLITVVSIPLFIIAIKSGKATYKSHKDTSKYERKYKYLEEVLTSRDSLVERSIFGFSKSINKNWQHQYELYRKINLSTTAKYLIWINIGSIITSFISLFIIIVFIKLVTSNILTVGMFISLVSATTSLVQMVSSQIASRTTQIARDMEFLKDLNKFLLLNEDDEVTCIPADIAFNFNTLEFRNVKFRYPDTEHYILNGLSFVINSEKHYAFVGSNGAGKTTIIKLITGLYDEYEGEILINGKDLKEYSKSYLKSIISVVYQDFAKYAISLSDNIGIGNINKIKSQENDKLIKDAISTMNLDDVISKLSQGIYTHLGKIKKDSLDISGGEWQRIALARSLINPAPIRILDEPTSALDPISESNIYEKFETISKGKTTILISHRLGSTKLAEEIFVLNDGKVIENGTHNDLINKQGIYAQMYESQKGWYM